MRLDERLCNLYWGLGLRCGGKGFDASWLYSCPLWPTVAINTFFRHESQKSEHAPSTIYFKTCIYPKFSPTDCGAIAFGNLAAPLLDRCLQQILGVFFQQAFLARIVMGMPLLSMKKASIGIVLHTSSIVFPATKDCFDPKWAW